MNAPVDVSFFARAAKPLTSYRKYWAARFGTAPFLPMSRAEMDQLGWDSCDIIVVTGDAYVDHPSFGMAVIGRTLEAQGFRVGIIAQPDWQSAEPFKALGKPNLFFGVTAGNMDSMINRYTADRKIRSDDAYTPGDVGGKRPDRAAIVYSQRCREAFKEVPIVLGGIEGACAASRTTTTGPTRCGASILVDAKCDLLLYGNAERAIVEIAHRLAAKEPVHDITDVRGTAFIQRHSPEGWFEIDSTDVDQPGRVEDHINPYQTTSEQALSQGTSVREGRGQRWLATAAAARTSSADLRPQSRPGKQEAQASRRATAPSSACRPTSRSRATRCSTPTPTACCTWRPIPAMRARWCRPMATADVWLNPPPIPLTTAEMDHVFGLPYARSPHPSYADEHGGHDGATKIPAWEMIRFSVNIMRGCFGGCTFCSITEHEGRIIQSRSEDSVIHEIEEIRDKVSGFTGVISDLGGPTANMYRIGCRSPAIEAACRKPSCVYPGICQNLNTDHSALIHMYRRARALKGVKKILIGSGLRYDLAVQSPEYVKELVQHHVGGYLKIAPEHTEQGPLTKMMKPGIGSYDKFKALFDKYSAEAGKKQYLVPYFIAAHPGTSDEDMMNLALWLKKNGFRADQVQTFYPSPMATATAMYHSGRNPLRKITGDSEKVDIVRGERRRRLHKAFLRYHDANNWPLLREALKAMGRADLIGSGKHQLIPAYQPITDGAYQSARRKNSTPLQPGAPRPGRVLTQHTGLPPRVTGAAKPPRKPR